MSQVAPRKKKRTETVTKKLKVIENNILHQISDVFLLSTFLIKKKKYALFENIGSIARRVCNTIVGHIISKRWL